MAKGRSQLRVESRARILSKASSRLAVGWTRRPWPQRSRISMFHIPRCRCPATWVWTRARGHSAQWALPLCGSSQQMGLRGLLLIAGPRVPPASCSLTSWPPIWLLSARPATSIPGTYPKGSGDQEEGDRPPGAVPLPCSQEPTCHWGRCELLMIKAADEKAKRPGSSQSLTEAAGGVRRRRALLLGKSRRGRPPRAAWLCPAGCFLPGLCRRTLRSWVQLNIYSGSSVLRGKPTCQCGSRPRALWQPAGKCCWGKSFGLRPGMKNFSQLLSPPRKQPSFLRAERLLCSGHFGRKGREREKHQ